MKKDYDKRVFHNLKPYHTDELEAYLVKMAEKGLYLLEMADYQMFFKKDIPSEVRYSIVLRESQHNRWEYQKFAEKLGWKFVCETSSYQIYVTENIEVNEVDTEAAKLNAVQIRRNKEVTYNILKIGSIFVLLYLLGSREGGLETILLSKLGLSIVLLGVMYGTLLCIDIIDTFCWKYVNEERLRKQEKLFFRHFTVTKRIRNLLCVLIFIDLGILVGISLGSWVVNLMTNGVVKSLGVIVMSSVYIIAKVIVSISRGEFSKRGGFERVCLEFLLVVIVYVTTYLTIR